MASEFVSKPKVIVSMASYPPRIDTVEQSIRSVLDQDTEFDKLILWLASCEFPQKEGDLPKGLLAIRDKRFEIGWADRNLGPHNKYYWTMRRYPESIVITVDDDLLYSPELVGNLIDRHHDYPRAIIAARTHLMMVRDDGSLLPYASWVKEQSFLLGSPSLALFSTNGAGSLFPPGCFDVSSIDLDELEAACLQADDIWLKKMGLDRRIPVVASSPLPLGHVEGTQESGLWVTVNSKGGNDRAIEAIQPSALRCGEDLLKDWSTCAALVARSYEGVSVEASLSVKKVERLASKNDQMKENLDRLLGEVQQERAQRRSLERKYQKLRQAKDDLAERHGALKEKYRLLKDKNAALREKCSSLKSKVQAQELLLSEPALVRLAKKVYHRFHKRGSENAR